MPIFFLGGGRGEGTKAQPYEQSYGLGIKKNIRIAKQQE